MKRNRIKKLFPNLVIPIVCIGLLVITPLVFQHFQNPLRNATKIIQLQDASAWQWLDKNTILVTRMKNETEVEVYSEDITTGKITHYDELTRAINQERPSSYYVWRVSPDGSKLFWYSFKKGQSEIVVSRLDGKEIRRYKLKYLNYFIFWNKNSDAILGASHSDQINRSNGEKIAVAVYPIQGQRIEYSFLAKNGEWVVGWTPEGSLLTGLSNDAIRTNSCSVNEYTFSDEGTNPTPKHIGDLKYFNTNLLTSYSSARKQVVYLFKERLHDNLWVKFSEAIKRFFGRQTTSHTRNPLKAFVSDADGKNHKEIFRDESGIINDVGWRPDSNELVFRYGNAVYLRKLD